MAVSDDVRPLQPAPEFERKPPQDVQAEQSVLGSMLMSKDAIADVIEILRSGDFYRPAHQLVFECILDLYGRGEPADPITVSAELTKQGTINRVGGAPYLHTLISGVAIAANASYYAKIVAEQAVLRRLVEAGTRIVQLGYGSANGRGLEVDDVVDRAQQAVYEVTERRTAEDYVILEQLLQGTLDEIESIGNRAGVMTGVPTGFADLDHVMNGLHPGQMIVIAARPGLGKALALETPLPTPSGWTTMGEVQVGDFLIGADGRPTQVVAATEIMTGRPCYEIEFSDGTVIVADAAHQWLTMSSRPRRLALVGERPELEASSQTVATTEEIAASLRDAAGRGMRHAIPLACPLDLPHADVPLKPGILGLWLADYADEAVVRGDPPFPSDGSGFHARLWGSVLDTSVALRELGVTDNKHIPIAYLRGSESQRRDLLAGLLDVGGTVNVDGSVEFAAPDEGLVEDVRELVHGLGYQSVAFETPALGRADKTGRTDETSTHHSLAFVAADDVFRNSRKRASHRARRKRIQRLPLRYVTDVRRVESVPVRCVQVDAADHLYLASRAMIPTHNSTLGLDFSRSCSIKHGMTSCIFSLEMSKSEITMRLLSAEAKVPLHHMRSGTMSDDDWARLARRMGEVANAPLFIDDSPNMTMMEIRAKARRLKQRHDLKMIVVDYLQLMSSPKRVENRQQEVSELSRGLKLLAKELEVPVIAISQLNRGSEQRTDKKPQLSDLRECLTADTLVTRCDNGMRVPIGDLVGQSEIPVWSLDEHLRLRPAVMREVWSTGRREVFRIRLASGRELRATANHPLLTVAGWKPVGEVTAQDAVAVARSVAAPVRVRPWPRSRIVLLAHLIGDGCHLARHALQYTTTDPQNAAAVQAAARDGFGIEARLSPERTRTQVYLPAPQRLACGRRNPFAEWLDELGLFGKRSSEKFVPEAVFGLPDEQIVLFLRHLFATDGSVATSEAGRVRVHYATTSRRLADDVQSLLLRLGIGARLRKTTPGQHRTGWAVDVSGLDDLRRFLTVVGVHGDRSLDRAEALRTIEATVGNPDVDVVPAQAWDYVRKAMREHGVTVRELAGLLDMSYCGSALYKSVISRSRMARVAQAIPDPYLRDLADSDVRWDRVVAVESVGHQEVFDARVASTHSFLANDVISHNSGAIEQDSDAVILLYREDAFEKESPRAGEADLILAKHRNGPTATVTVAFQGHYSRFVDMSPG